MRVAYSASGAAIRMGLEDAVDAANQIAAGALTVDDGPTVAIPRDSQLVRAGGPVVVVRLIGDDYAYNPRADADVLVIEQFGRVYLHRATYMAQGRFRNSAGVVAEENVMVRGVSPPLFRVAGREPGRPGLLLKYETLARTSLFTEQLLSEDEAAGATYNLSPVTIYFRSTLPARSSLIYQPVFAPVAQANPAPPVFDQNVAASNYAKRLNQVRLTRIEWLRSARIGLPSGRMARIPVNGFYAYAPPKGANPCILIRAMDNEFTSRVDPGDEDAVLVFVIGAGASVNLASMDDETWDAWAKHRDSTAEHSIIYHRMADGVDGVEQLRLAAGPDPGGRAVAEMRLRMRIDADATDLPVLQVTGRSAPAPDQQETAAQLFFPVMLSVGRERDKGIYRRGQGGSHANNMFVFEDAVIPAWGKTRGWNTSDILHAMLPVLDAPPIKGIPDYVEWMEEKWQTARIDLALLLRNVALGYVSPSNAFVLVDHAGQRVPVSALLFYALWDFPSDFAKMGDVMVHPWWHASMRGASGAEMTFPDPVGTVVARRNLVAAGRATDVARPSAKEGALAEAEKWHNSVLGAFLRSDINNIALLADVAMGVESDEYAWELVSVLGERFAVSGLMFQLAFVFSAAAQRPFISMDGMYFRHDWWTYLVERAPGLLLFVDPVGEVKTRKMRPLAPNKRLRGEKSIQN
jgi:hypothetical protein